jgi:hypothetical protein
MDSVSAASAASTTPTTSSSTSPTSASKTDASGKSFSELFTAAKQDLKKGETLTKVDGHDYARIKGGTRDDMCVNLSGNARSGQAFDLIWRDGRQFHVYGGSGADHKVVEVGRKAATTDASTTTPASTTPAASTTTPATTDATSAAATPSS